jgi:hypothetical protein
MINLVGPHKHRVQQQPPKVGLSQTCDNDCIDGLQLPGNVSTSAGAFSRLLYQSQFVIQAPNL